MRAVVRGSGSIGRRHTRVLIDSGLDVSLWPVRPRTALGVDQETGARLVDDAHGPEYLHDADLVVVATDTSRHVADTVAALDAGARVVLVEKPVAPTINASRSLSNHPRAGSVAVAAPLRAHAGFRRTFELLPQLGTPVAAHVSCQSWLPDWRPDRDYRESYSARADEGGVLRDLVHEIDYSSVLFGEAHLLGAALEHDGPLEIEAEQAATLLWSTTNAQVTMRLDYISRPGERRCTVHGPKGMLLWNVLTQTVTLVSDDGETTQTFEQDRDRNRIMGTQVTALLELGPDAPAARRIPAGAPATLAEGLDVLSLCDRARALNPT